MCRKVPFLLALVVAIVATPSLLAVDLDGDGRVDIGEIPLFDPFDPELILTDEGVEDLDGLKLVSTRLLDLAGNRIDQVEAGDFSDASSLVFLILSHNPIVDIEPGAFEGLSNLGRLELSRLDLTSVGVGTFDGLPELHVLSLGGSTSRIEVGAFDSLSKLHTLNLPSSGLVRIESGLFNSLGQLQNLKLSTNGLTEIADRAFDGLNNLSFLNLRSTDLSTLNFTGATFDRLEPCNVFGGFCVDPGEITELRVDQAVLSDGAFQAIVGELDDLTKVSMVGLTFSDEPPSDLDSLLSIASLSTVTVNRGFFDRYATELAAFDRVDGKVVNIVPEPRYGMTMFSLCLVLCCRHLRKHATSRNIFT